MANRNKNQNYGRENERRGNYGNRWSQSGRGGYGSDFDYEREDEGYFGGGRQMGEGNRSGDSVTNYNDSDDYNCSNSSSQSRRNRNYERDKYNDSLNEYGGGGTYGGYRQRRYRSSPPNFGSARSDYGERAYGGRLNDEGMEEDRSWLDRAGDEVASWFGDKEAEQRRQQDIRGGHRGRGPKNYTRSDERICEEINDRLTEYDYLDASDIEVQVSSGDVTLTGNVDSRYAKRIAEDISEDVSGVKNVENRLRVSQSSSSLGTSGTSGTSSMSNPQNSTTNSGMGMPDRVSGSTGNTELMKTKSNKKTA